MFLLIINIVHFNRSKLLIFFPSVKSFLTRAEIPFLQRMPEEDARPSLWTGAGPEAHAHSSLDATSHMTRGEKAARNWSQSQKNLKDVYIGENDFYVREKFKYF